MSIFPRAPIVADDFLVTPSLQTTSLSPACMPIKTEDTISLRHSVLWPNAPLSKVRLPEDDDGWHFGAFVESEADPVAVISIFLEPLPIDNNQVWPSGTMPITAARFRKFACDPSYQGRGVGTKLLKHARTFAQAELNANVVWCDARTSTRGWYEKRGMVPFGETFFKGPVEYVRMQIGSQDLSE